LLVTSLSAASLLYTEHGWQPCASINHRVDLLGVDRHGKLTFEQVSLAPADRQKRPLFLGTMRSCGAFSPSSLVQDSNGDRWEVSRIVNEMTIGELRFEVTSGSHTDIPFSREAWDAIWNCLLREGIAGRDGIRIRARRPASDERLPNETKVWRFERIDSRIYGTAKKDILTRQSQSVDLADFVAGLLYVFRNEDGVCEFNRNASLLTMTIADYCVRVERPFAMQFDSLQHSAVVGLVVDSTNSHALARGLCAFILPESLPEHELRWSTASWNPISGGVILSGKVN
jgi:hypothetical protein